MAWACVRAHRRGPPTNWGVSTLIRACVCTQSCYHAGFHLSSQYLQIIATLNTIRCLLIALIGHSGGNNRWGCTAPLSQAPRWSPLSRTACCCYPRVHSGSMTHHLLCITRPRPAPACHWPHSWLCHAPAITLGCRRCRGQEAASPAPIIPEEECPTAAPPNYS